MSVFEKTGMYMKVGFFLKKKKKRVTGGKKNKTPELKQLKLHAQKWYDQSWPLPFHFLITVSQVVKKFPGQTTAKNIKLE